MVKKMHFSIDADGNVELSIEGAVGDECESMSRPFEEELGILTSRNYKDSYYTTPETVAQSNEGSCGIE